MQFKSVLIAVFALLSALAVWDMATFDAWDVGRSIVDIDIEIDHDRQNVNLNPARQPDFQEERSLAPIAAGAQGGAAGAVRTVAVDSMMGRLDVVPSQTGELTAEYTLRIWGDGSQRGTEQAASLAREVAVEWVREGDRARLALRRPEVIPNGTVIQVNLRIGVPAGVGIDADYIGNVGIEGISGPVRFGAAAGKIAIQQVQGPVTVAGRAAEVSLKDIQGAVEAEINAGMLGIERVQGPVHGSIQFGELVLQEVSGDVDFRVSQGVANVRHVGGNLTLTGSLGEGRVAGVAGHTDINYSFGTLHVTLAGPADITLGMGDVDVYLEGAGGWSVDASTEVGEIETALPLSRERSNARSRVWGTIGDGTHELKVAVNQGAVTLGRR